MESKVVKEKKSLFIVFTNKDRVKLLEELRELVIDCDLKSTKKTDELIKHLEGKSD